jgi:cation/acetate symporter
VLKSGEVGEDEQVRVSRITAVVLGVVAIGLGILANGQNVAFLVALAFAIAAAANLPTILFSLYWPRFNTRGALWRMYGGLISTLVLIVFSPAVSGAKTAMLPSMDFAWFPLANPGIVSIPLAIPARRRRNPDVVGSRRSGDQCGDGGAVADRCGGGAGHQALTPSGGACARLDP